MARIGPVGFICTLWWSNQEYKRKCSGGKGRKFQILFGVLPKGISLYNICRAQKEHSGLWMYFEHHACMHAKYFPPQLFLHQCLLAFRKHGCLGCFWNLLGAKIGHSLFLAGECWSFWQFSSVWSGLEHSFYSDIRVGYVPPKNPSVSWATLVGAFNNQSRQHSSIQSAQNGWQKQYSNLTRSKHGNAEYLTNNRIELLATMRTPTFDPCATGPSANSFLADVRWPSVWQSSCKNRLSFSRDSKQMATR